MPSAKRAKKSARATKAESPATAEDPAEDPQKTVELPEETSGAGSSENVVEKNGVEAAIAKRRSRGSSPFRIYILGWISERGINYTLRLLRQDKHAAWRNCLANLCAVYF